MRRQAHVQQAEADFMPLPFDAEAARAFARVASSLPVYTANPSDFQGITGLTVEGL
jgi:predicted nucleic acid-binding protein